MKRLIIYVMAVCFAMAGYAQRFEPKWAGEVVALQIDTDTIATPTEKSNVQIKTSQSAGQILVGIGNIRQKIVIKGGQSAVQLDPEKPTCLIVRWKDNEFDPASFIQLVKFEEKKKERKAEIANVNWLGTVTEGDMKYVPFTAERYGNKSYIIFFQPEEGEYGVRVLNPDNQDEQQIIFNCFGIHYRYE